MESTIKQIKNGKIKHEDRNTNTNRYRNRNKNKGYKVLYLL